MTTPDASFVYGTFKKHALLSIIVMLICGILWGSWISFSIFCGAVLVSVNVLFMKWIIGKMASNTSASSSSAVKLTGFFMLKLLVLFGTTYYLIASFKIHPLGFVLGYVLFLASSVIHTLVTDYPDEDQGTERVAGSS